MSTCEIAEGTNKLYRLGYATQDSDLPEIVTWLNQRTAIGLDVETGGLNPLTDGLATIQLGDPRGTEPRAYVIDVRCVSAEAMRPILDYLESRNTQKLGVNISFEYRFLRNHYNVRLRRLADVQVAEQVIRAGLLPEERGAHDDEGHNKAAYRTISMAALAKRYLGVILKHKDDGLRLSFLKTPAGTHNQEQLEYAAGDVIYPFYIAQAQRKEIEARELKEIIEIEFESIPILAEAQYTGMNIDQAAWRQLWQEAEAIKARTEDQLDTHFMALHPQQELDLGGARRPMYKDGATLKYTSSEHIRWALAEYCKAINWPIEVVTSEERARALKSLYGANYFKWLQNKDPKATVDDIPDYVVPTTQAVILTSAERAILRMAKIHKQLPTKLVDLLVEYSEAAKRASTFGIEFLNKHVSPITNRIHPEINQAITSTGRLSETPNLQNIPRDPRYRHCFIPAPGYSFVIADYSQIEPRLSAQVSGDPVYVSTFVDSDDIYVRVAEAMTGHRPAKDSPERQMFKTIVLALAYRMGAPKLWKQLCLALEKEILSGQVPLPTLDFVRELHSKFFNIHSGIKEYQDNCAKLADPTEGKKMWDVYAKAPVTWITAPCGRKRFFAPNHGSVYTEAPNAPIQGCSATITKAAACLVQRYIDEHKLDATVVHLVHDEILWEVRDDQAAAFAPIAKDLMEQAGKRWITAVPVKAEFPKGTNGVVKQWTKEVDRV